MKLFTFTLSFFFIMAVATTSVSAQCDSPILFDFNSINVPANGGVCIDGTEFAGMGVMLSLSLTNDGTPDGDCADGQDDELVIIDTDAPPVGDGDLGVNQGNAVIVGDKGQANDDDNGGMITFSFTVPAIVCNTTLADLEGTEILEITACFSDNTTASMMIDGAGNATTQTIDFVGVFDKPVSALKYEFNGSGAFINLNFGTNPLPVELTKFEGKAVANTVQLDWATATETNNAHFEVERSADGTKFNAIGQVKGAGTTIDAQQYRFVDENPYAGINYYRLKQVDTDGTYEYIDPIAVAVTNKTDVRLAPNPVRDVTTIFALPEGSTQMTLLNYQGKIVRQWNTLNVGQRLDFSDLPSGNYVVQITNASGVTTQTIAKVD